MERDLSGFWENTSPWPKMGELFLGHPVFHEYTRKLYDDGKSLAENLSRPWGIDRTGIYKKPCWQPELSESFIRMLKNIAPEHSNKLEENCVLLCREIHCSEGYTKNFFERLAFLFKQRGFCVWANCLMPENQIKGAINIKFDVSDLVAFANKVAAVVSARNGLCDLIAEKRKRLFVLYESEKKMKYCDSLPDFYGIKDINEYIFGTVSPEQIVSKAIENMKP